MSVVVVPFPARPPVRVAPDGFGGWLVTWRKHGELHGSREDALADAWTVAIEYGVQAIVVEISGKGGAA